MAELVYRARLPKDAAFMCVSKECHCSPGHTPGVGKPDARISEPARSRIPSVSEGGSAQDPCDSENTDSERYYCATAKPDYYRDDGFLDQITQQVSFVVIFKRVGWT